MIVSNSYGTNNAEAVLAVHPPPSTPQLEITDIPVFDQGSQLCGMVYNASPTDFRIAVYLQILGTIWTKPSFDQPVTIIQSNGTWCTSVVTGGLDRFASGYAVFLIPANYQPELRSGDADLPPSIFSNSVAHIFVDRPSPNLRNIRWSSLDWEIKDTYGSIWGPGPNIFSSRNENVWVGGDGKLHLVITFRNGQWRCPEIIGPHLGYGTYRFYLSSSVDYLDSNVVLGLFTWSDNTIQVNREIDIEASRWGRPADTNNSQFVRQPSGQAGNLLRWFLPPEVTNSVLSFVWEPPQIYFQALAGSYPLNTNGGNLIANWIYNNTNSIPTPYDERVRLNLWLFKSVPPVDGHDVEVVLEKFEFLPHLSVRSLGQGTGQFELRIAGAPQTVYHLEVSTNLINWTTNTNINVVFGESAILKTVEPGPLARFYRISFGAGN